MSAGRKTSVQRHIDNPNIHNGRGRVEPYAGSSNGSEKRKHPSRKVFQGVSHEHLWFRQIESLARGYIENKMSKGLLREFVKFRDGES